MNRSLLTHWLPALALTWLLPVGAAATVIQLTYQIDASAFQDSNLNPPTAPTSTSVSGTYTFTLDTSIPSQLGIVPDQVIGLDIVDHNGVTMDYDTTNSAVNSAVNIFLDYADLTIGGTFNGVAFMVGLSDDFRTRFRISLANYQVIAAPLPLVFDFVTTADPFYQSPASVTLLSVSPVPAPGASLLVAAALAGGGGLAARRRRS